MNVEVSRELSKLNPPSLSFKILCFLTFSEKPYKPKELAGRLGINPATARARLSELFKIGLVVSGSEGYSSSVLPYDIIECFIKYHEQKKFAEEVSK